MKDNCKKIRKLLNEGDIRAALVGMAAKIVSWAKIPDSAIIMGMASRGIPIAKEIAKILESKHNLSVPVGSIDASYYRDDFHYRKRVGNQPLKITEMPANVEGKTVVLIDDVLYTGRSVRAALQAILDLGRPAAVKLCVLVDRGCRELPIAPDCTGLSIETEARQEVRVSLSPYDEESVVWLVEIEEEVA
ncbi:MAG: bifunctional pyr operon transcriptional regulator/uracil phosphoribosyltransferase PyrR [Fibromonadaceae bacterium]|jgi:pyrimidine operon attenuation protein/uracil phosphoribosyltransferase|nr:bifunctional pyr operon transcriptional regulator/uracil phosphoribosyltransferase PyrR [Fibromonadaceae bacterium]